MQRAFTIIAVLLARYFYCRIGYQTLQSQAISDPRHFGTEGSGHFGPSPLLSLDASALKPNCLKYFATLAQIEIILQYQLLMNNF